MKKACALCGSIDDKGVLKTCGSCGEATWIPLADQAPLMPEPPRKKKRG
jgi:hypothetical protein